MMRVILACLALLVSGAAALAQSGCSYVATGAVLTSAQWNQCFSQKQNTLVYTPVNKAGDTMTGKLVLATSTTDRASLNIPQGVAPTTPVNGDIWTTSVGIFARINGATIGPLLSGTGSFAATAPITVSVPSGVVTYAIAFGATLNSAGSVLNCTTATAGQIGCARPDNTTITVSGGVLTAVGAATTTITVGTTLVGSGTNTRVLFNNAGVLGEYAVSGTGNVLLSTGPSIVGGALSGTFTGNPIFATLNSSGYVSFAGTTPNPGTLGASRGVLDFASSQVRMFSNSGSGGVGGGLKFFSKDSAEVDISVPFEISASATPNVYLAQTVGRVGIGTASPSTQLHTTGGVRLAGVPSTGNAVCGDGAKVNIDSSGNVTCKLANQYIVNCDNTGATECTDLQTQITACLAAGGGKVVVPAGKFLLNNGVTAAGACIVEGQGSTQDNSNTAPGLTGTWFLQTTTTNSMFTITGDAAGGGGMQFRNFAVRQAQAADAGWSHVAYKAVFVDNSANSIYENIFLPNVNVGFEFTSSGALVKNLAGACFSQCIRVKVSNEYQRYEGLYFHSSFVGPGNANQIAYILANSTAIRSEKADSHIYSNVNVFGFQAGFYLTTNGSGGSTNIKISNYDCDNCKYGLIIDGASPSGSQTTISGMIVNNNAITASVGIECSSGNACSIIASNVVLNSSAYAAIRAFTSADIAVSNLRIFNCNASNTGFSALETNSGSATITVGGRFTRSGGFCSVDGAGAGPINLSHVN